MKIIIGCPVYQREWILEDWFKLIEKQTFPLDQIGFVFELAPNDKDTHQILFDWHADHPEVWCFDAQVNDKEAHLSHPEGRRIWNKTKYQMMVNFRNSLLDRVTCWGPDRYFSLDSDILLTNPKTIEALASLTGQVGAASPLCYMSPHTCEHPNIMSWHNAIGARAKREIYKYPIGEVFKADIIMAAVMMRESVYKDVRYRVHSQGEDLGWSAECTKAGYSLYVASHIYAEHIMSKSMYDVWKTGALHRSGAGIVKTNISV